MTGGIAHDVRNILSVIDSGLRLAELNLDNPDRARTFLAGARQGVGRGLRLTSQLLDFARHRAMPISAVDINELLATLKLFLKNGAGSSVRIDFKFSPKIPKCLIDPSQFVAAILNLVLNARDAMPHGGEIQITTACCEIEPDPDASGLAGTYVQVCVTDNGLGMAADVSQKMFEPFFTTKGDNGTGLGIPQVCAFINHVGGRLSVKSELGRGTAFDLYFPAFETGDNLPQRELLNQSALRFDSA